MDILDNNGQKIGHWSSREISSLEELLPNTQDHQQIMDDIREKITRFPVIELTDIHIYDSLNRRKGHGRSGMEEFLRHAKSCGYGIAVVQIGKRSISDSLDGNTAFYTKLGWLRFVTPTPFSLRFAYFDLGAFQPV